MITPTVGRVVWFYKWNANAGHQGPLAAHVCKVHSDTCVNLMVIGESGVPFSECSVQLLQPREPREGAHKGEGQSIPQSNYCEWMPYQKGQAAKTEALEKATVAK